MSKYAKWVITVLTVLVLTACGSTGEKASTDQKKDSKDESRTIKIGYNQGTGVVLANIAEQEGFFEKENLKVEYVPFASAIDGLSALQAGKIDGRDDIWYIHSISFYFKRSGFLYRWRSYVRWTSIFSS